MTDIEWRLFSPQTVQKGDCLIFDISSPYSASDTYQAFPSFQTQPVKVPCSFSSSHEAQCQLISGSQLQVTFTQSNQSRKLTGQTTSQIFLTPYSTRKIKQVTISYFNGCKIIRDEGLSVQGVDSITTFQQQIIQSSDVLFSTDSKIQSDKNAQLQLKFTPKTSMKAAGQLAIKVPGWYIIQRSNFKDQPDLYSAESQLDEDSVLTFKSPDGVRVTNSRFDQANRTLLVSYQAAADINSPVTVIITNFKNAVNQRPKSGFGVTTLDEFGFLINSSDSDLMLVADLNQIAGTGDKEVLMLGDASGNNIGRIGTYQQLALYYSSQIPFEQGCYWKFEFPTSLKLDDQLSTVIGEGIFKPKNAGNYLSSDEFRVDLKTNTVIVSGCQDPSTLSSRPFGNIIFGVIKLPDYMMRIKPINVRAYADSLMSQLVLEEINDEGSAFNEGALQPGLLNLQLFSPSNDFAFVQNVSYTIIFTPSHTCTKDTRILITMPKYLIFDASKGCKAEVLVADCILDAKTNKIVLLNAFNKDFAGGQQLKVIISPGTNPIGSRDAGPWGIQTEMLFDGQYYLVDGETSPTSFFAKPGFIKSKIEIDNQITYSPVRMNFTFTTEHSIPAEGELSLMLPSELNFEKFIDGTDPSSYFSVNNDQMQVLKMTSQSIIFGLPQGHLTSNGPLSISLQRVITPRSFKTSSGFQVNSSNKEGYIIDAGGNDIAVTMSVMNLLESVSITPANFTNGAVTSYRVKFRSSVLLKSGDQFFVTLPDDLSVSNKLSCQASQVPIGIKQAQCSNVANKIQVQLIELTKSVGEFEFQILGIRNPSSFKPTKTFSNIYIQTSDYFNITQASSKTVEKLFIQNKIVAIIDSYTITQQSGEFGGIGFIELSFTPVNPLGDDGSIILQLNDQIQIFDDTVCKIQTYKSFGNENCSFEKEKQTLVIKDVFKDGFKSQINVVLSKIRNPLSNRNLEEFQLRTFADAKQLYPVDLLILKPKLRCLYPCLDCGSTPDQCISCWQDDPNPFLMIDIKKQTCQSKCDPGYTSNGDLQKQCSRCESSCETCADNGNLGDRNLCLTCGSLFNFLIPSDYSCIGPNCTGSCQTECPTGMYDGGNGVCMRCDPSCLTCFGRADNCKSCQLASKRPYLFGSSCIEECPLSYGANSGVCHKCESPCKSCGIGPTVCESCDGMNGLSLNLGPTCVGSCPSGFITNLATGDCEGCGAGCVNCDKIDQRICLKCESKLKLLKGVCISDCPKGYLANFDATECISKAQKDVKVVYFPWLALTIIVFSLSYVGGKTKPKHLIVPNFLVMMGVVENLSLLTQIIMTYKFGTWRFIGPVLVAWIFYLIGNPVFTFVFNWKIGDVDPVFIKWQNLPENSVTKKILLICGSTLSWKFHKLLYSHFWGFNIKQAAFKEPTVFRSTQKWFLIYNCIATYSIVIFLNFYGLYDMDWGTQLYISFIENVIICLIMAILGGWEQRQQTRDYLSDELFIPITKGKNARVFAAALDEPDEVGATKDDLLKKFKNQKGLVETKFDELMDKLNGRDCFSCCDFQYEKEEDPRRIHTWPLQVSVEVDPNPPEPFPDLFPDNVYADGLTAEQIFMIRYLQRNLQQKNLQAEHGFSTDQALRQDAELVANKRKLVMSSEVEHSIEKKKQRGRKNRFFKQIDNEDNDAGALLDSDDEGNKRAKRAIDLEFKRKKDLAAIKEEEEREIQKSEIQMRRQQKKMHALRLTEETMRLKQQLEKQRHDTELEEMEFQKLLADEKERTKLVQEKIDQANQIKESKRLSLVAEFTKKQQQQQDEINQMIEKNRKRINDEAQMRESNDLQIFLKDKREIERKIEAERQERQLERAETQNAKANAGITSQHVISDQSVTAQALNQMSAIKRDSVKMDSAIQLSFEDQLIAENKSQLGQSFLGQSDIGEKMGPDVRRLASEIGNDEQPFPLGDADIMRKSVSQVADVLQSKVSPSQVQSPYLAASFKIKPENDRSTVHDNISYNKAAHMSMLQTDEASFVMDANFSQQMFFEPDFDYRSFNEIDIIGDLDRDERGNVLLFLDEATGMSVYVDAQNRSINAFGYLVDRTTGDVLSLNGAKAFDRRDLDERGNIPMPYALEKYNFNPFDLQGEFKFTDVNDPLSFKRKVQREEILDVDMEFDDQMRLINAQGFLMDDNGSLLDRNSRVRFDWRQFASHGGLIPKLYNYQGKTFEIHEVMGVFDRDSLDNIKFVRGKDENGRDVAVDKAGYMVNNKGYIINKEGCICTRQGKVLFLASHLKNGEFPKIFPFTRFNINRILGDFDLMSNGQPVLTSQNGMLFDKQGRHVNAKGYLIDSVGNVIDIRKKLVFEKKILDSNGDIPEIFQINLLRSDSQSSLSRLMSEIDKEQQLFEDAKAKRRTNKRQLGNQSDTSFESMMDDSPSKYDQQNQRFSNSSAPERAKFHISARWADAHPDDIQEESDGDLEAGEVGPFKKRKKKRRAPLGAYIVEEITDRDVQLAAAYGGEAKPRIRKTGQKFGTIQRGGDRSALQTAQQPVRQAGQKIQNLAVGKDALLNSGVAIAGIATTKESARRADEKTTGRTANQTQQRARSRGTASRNPAIHGTNSMWQDQHAHNRTIDDDGSQNKRDEKRSRTKDVKRAKPSLAQNPKNLDSRSKNGLPQYDQAFEEEFEKLYKKDIDKFIDGSDFEVESLAGFSDLSKGTFKSVARDPKMKDLEKVYLQRLEFQQLGQMANEHPKPKKRSKPRPFMDRFMDDPREIVRGEQMKLQTGPLSKESPRQQQVVNNRSQSSLPGAPQPVASRAQPNNRREIQTPDTANVMQLNMSRIQHSSQAGRH